MKLTFLLFNYAIIIMSLKLVSLTVNCKDLRCHF
nr:MAG TPA: hypothetical protein [Microviridae sp.]